MKIIIKDVIGQRCIIKEDGKKIFNIILDPIKSGKIITLDFEGVNQFASPFFNIAIGQLLKDKTITKEKLLSNLKFDNINEIGKMVAERVIDNAAKYHGDKDYSKIVDDILEQQEGESE